MTVPPNYGPPPEQPHTPGYGYQSPHSSGPSPYGSQPQYGGQQPPYAQEPQYGGGQQPAYGQEPQYGGGGQQPPYGQDPGHGGPVLPPEPPKRNLALIGGIAVGVTVLVLGATLLITMNLRGDETDGAQEGDSTSEAASDEATTEETATTAEKEDSGGEVGRCLPYESEISGDGFALVECADPTAFWEITAQSYDVTDVAVDDEGRLVDRTAVDELCGADWGLLKPGETWTDYDYVYSSGTLDSLYCVQATGSPDPAEAGHLPVVPDVGDCFNDADQWWSVDCGSDIALYEAVDVIMYDEPVQDMSDSQAETDGAACSSDWYWKVTDRDGRTSAILCANDL
jgi:hypothetical protein